MSREVRWADILQRPSIADPAEPFVTIGNSTGLTAERSLVGTANQIVVTDGGAGSTVTLSTPQNLHTSATPTFGTLTLGTTTGNVLVVDTTTLVVDATNDRIGIGTATPSTALEVSQDSAALIRNTNYVSSTVGARFQGRKARGTAAAPRRIQSGDTLGGINFFGAEAADDVSAATFTTASGQFTFTAAESFTATGHGTYWAVGVVPIGSTTSVERLRVTDDGRIKVASNAGRVHIPVVATASLPAAGAAEDGSILIEDAGAGNRNLIIYAEGQRFRIDGGAAF